jgi:hypothetical protein
MPAGRERGVAQDIKLDGVSPVKKTHLALLTDGVQVKPGTEQMVELRFRVDEGYHINSHAPMDDLLIPTTLKFVPGAVKVVRYGVSARRDHQADRQRRRAGRVPGGVQGAGEAGGAARILNDDRDGEVPGLR